MEEAKIRKILYNTPNWQVISYLLQHPNAVVRGANLVQALPYISKSAVYNAVRALGKIEVLVKEKGQEGYTLNIDNIWLRHFMIADVILTLQSLVRSLSRVALKVILFGSRASGDYTADSDYDLFVVSSREKDVRNIISKSVLAEHIQLLLKTPEERLDLHRTEPELYQSLQQGIVLWDQK